MGNPICPFCKHALKLETKKIRPEKRSSDKKSYWIGVFWVCHNCKKHWPRSASIMKVTARSGVTPRKG